MAKGTLKIAAALAGVRGKAIDRVFVAQYRDRFQLFVVFADATYYEFYGTGEISGARAIDPGDATTVREFLAHGGGDVVEIGLAAVRQPSESP